MITPDLDQRVDTDRPDLSDFAPDGDVVPDDATPVHATFDTDDDDWQVIEDYTKPANAPVIDGTIVGVKTPHTKPAKTLTYVVSATVSSESAPFQVLPYAANRAALKVIVSGRGVRIAPSTGDLYTAGAVPAMYPDGGAMLDFPCYRDPLVIDGAEVTAGMTVKVTCYVTVEVTENA